MSEKELVALRLSEIIEGKHRASKEIGTWKQIDTDSGRKMLSMWTEEFMELDDEEKRIRIYGSSSGRTMTIGERKLKHFIESHVQSDHISHLV